MSRFCGGLEEAMMMTPKVVRALYAEHDRYERQFGQRLMAFIRVANNAENEPYKEYIESLKG